MSCFYAISGSIRCHNVPAVHALVRRINNIDALMANEFGANIVEDESEDPPYPSDTVTIEIVGAGSMTHAAADALEALVSALTPYVDLPARISTIRNGVQDWLYLSKPNRAQNDSYLSRIDIEDLLVLLLPTDALAIALQLVELLDNDGRIELANILTHSRDAPNGFQF